MSQFNFGNANSQKQVFSLHQLPSPGCDRPITEGCPGNPLLRQAHDVRHAPGGGLLREDWNMASLYLRNSDDNNIKEVFSQFNSLNVGAPSGVRPIINLWTEYGQLSQKLNKLYRFVMNNSPSRRTKNLS